jgi:hypothetical protein
MSTSNLLGGKRRPARRTENFAVVVVPNVKVGWRPNTSSHPFSLHDLLRESFTFSDVYYQIITYRMCHNMVLGGGGSDGCWRELRTEGLHDLYSSPDVMTLRQVSILR